MSYPYSYDDLQHHYDPNEEKCGLGYECEQLEKRKKEQSKLTKKEQESTPNAKGETKIIKRGTTPEQALAVRILNFVMPYIPDHVREEALEIIKRETSKPASIKDTTKHNFAHTTIRWKEDDEEENVIFKLSPYNEFTDKNIDEQIFFYCENEEEYKELVHDGYDNGQDFVIVGCTMFTEEL